LGFVLGVSSAGIAATGGVISLLITFDRILQLENAQPSLSSAISLTLAITTLAISFFLIRGSLWIWRFSVYGGAVNLALGFVTIVLSYGVASLFSPYVTNLALANYLLASYMFASIASITSGALGSAAHYQQLTRRFAAFSSSEAFKVKVSVDGGQHEIEVSGSTTGQNLKAKACEKGGLSRQETRLLFRGKAVRDNASLRELGAGDGDQFTLLTE
jgi:hypothetical protein